MKGPVFNLAFILIIFIAAVLLWGTITNGHDWGDDFASYIMQTESILDGSPGRFAEGNRFTIESSSFVIGPVAYPWGFPLLLAPVYALFGLNFIVLKSVTAVFYLLFLILVWFGFRKFHSRLWLFFLVCLFSLNPYLLSFSDRILSDIYFLLFSTLSVLLMGALVIEKRRIISPVFDPVILGFSIAVAFFIRIQGVLLLATLAAVHLVALVRELRHKELLRRGRAASFKAIFFSGPDRLRNLCISLAPFATFFCAAAAWGMFFPRTDSSQALLIKGISPEWVTYNLEFYLNVLDVFFLGVPGSNLFYGAALAVSVYGLLKRYRADYHIVIYVFLTFLFFICYPYQGEARLIFPVLPFFCSFALTGLESFAEAAPAERKLRRFISFAPVVFIIFYFANASISIASENLAYGRRVENGPFTESSKNMFAFIKENTDPESVVVFFKPRVMGMITGRKSILINTEGELSRGDYVCLFDRAGSYQVPPDVISRFSEQGAAKLIYESKEFRVYRLIKPKS